MYSSSYPVVVVILFQLKEHVELLYTRVVGTMNILVATPVKRG